MEDLSFSRKSQPLSHSTECGTLVQYRLPGYELFSKELVELIADIVLAEDVATTADLVADNLYQHLFTATQVNLDTVSNTVGACLSSYADALCSDHARGKLYQLCSEHCAETMRTLRLLFADEIVRDLRFVGRAGRVVIFEA